MHTRIEDFNTASRDHFEKMSASSAAVARGVHTVVSETTDYSRRSFEQAAAFGEQLLGARSFETAVQLQTDYARTQSEALVAQVSKMSDLYRAIATDAFQPVESAVERTKANVTH